MQDFKNIIQKDKGLSNEHLRHCHTLVRVPTFKFSSLNLSQAVMIICYEIFINSVPTNKRDIPRFANNFELEGMYDHLKSVLMKIGYLNPQNPERWMLNVRRLFSRYRLRAREASVIRGICRQVDWYTSQASRAEGRGSSDKK